MNKVLKYFAYFLGFIGIIVSESTNIGSMFIFFDEPEMPISMIE